MSKLKHFLSLPKTLLFNLAVFPFRIAIKLPVLIAYNVKLANLNKGCIEIKGEVSRYMIRINMYDGSGGVNSSLKKSGYFDVKGKIIFNGKANFATGVSIRVDDQGELIFGDNFNCNMNCFLSCSNKVTLGNDVLLGWSINIRDSDGHNVFDLDDRNVETNISKPVSIGNHVWVASNVDILKGVNIPDDCVVGYRSCVTKNFEEKNCIIAGYPAKVVKRNINWSV